MSQRKRSLREEWERLDEPRPPDGHPYWEAHGTGENRWDTISVVLAVVAVLALIALFG